VVVDGGPIGRRRDGVRIFAAGSAAGGMPKTFSIRLRLTIGTRRRRSVIGEDLVGGDGASV
jgi:hypothetical protein